MLRVERNHFIAFHRPRYAIKIVNNGLMKWYTLMQRGLFLCTHVDTHKNVEPKKKFDNFPVNISAEELRKSTWIENDFHHTHCINKSRCVLRTNKNKAAERVCLVFGPREWIVVSTRAAYSLFCIHKERRQQRRQQRREKSFRLNLLFFRISSTKKKMFILLTF